MNKFKDLIYVIIFTLGLVSLYYTTNHIIALTIISFLIGYLLYQQAKFQKITKYRLNKQIKILESLFNASSDIIIYQDINNKIIACNDALTYNFGIPKSDSIGHSLNDIFDKYVISKERIPIVKSLLEEKINYVIKNQKTTQFYKEFYAKGNNFRYFNILIFPAFSNKNKLNGFIIVARDVTSEKLAVENAKEKSMQLNSILLNLPMCAYIKDINNHYIIGSKIFEKYINLPLKKLKEIDLSEIYGDEAKEDIFKEDAIIIKNKTDLCIERLVSFPETSFYGKIKKAPILNTNGDVEYIVVIFENIEAEKEIERQREQFIETLIHDLKIPTLAQVRGLELLEDNTIGELNLDQKDLVTEIKSSCKYMLDMISMIKNTYRIENKKISPIYNIFNLKEILIECFNDLEIIASSKQNKFLITNINDNLNIVADRQQLKKVITNLLSNAIIYSNSNNIIEIKTFVKNNYLKINIISDGIVLTKKECDSLFDAIIPEASNYSTVGHSIGLYLCKKIIEIHRGKIYAKNVNAKNVFTFIIPLSPSADNISSNEKILDMI